MNGWELLRKGRISSDTFNFDCLIISNFAFLGCIIKCVVEWNLKKGRVKNLEKIRKISTLCITDINLSSPNFELWVLILVTHYSELSRTDRVISVVSYPSPCSIFGNFFQMITCEPVEKIVLGRRGRTEHYQNGSACWIGWSWLSIKIIE